METKAGRAILIPNKIDFKPKTVVRDKEGQGMMIKDQFNKRI